jgi:hypothetical protein
MNLLAQNAFDKTMKKYKGDTKRAAKDLKLIVRRFPGTELADYISREVLNAKGVKQEDCR